MLNRPDQALFYFIVFGLSTLTSAHSTPEKSDNAQDRLLKSVNTTGAETPKSSSSENFSKMLPGFFFTPEPIFSGKTPSDSSRNQNSSRDAEMNNNAENSGFSIAAGQDASLPDTASGNSGGGNRNTDRSPTQSLLSSGTTGGGGAVQGTARKLNYWWPVCAFIDSTVSDSKANAELKGLVDSAAKCDVAIQLYPIKVNTASWSDNPDQINKATVDKCNLPNGLAGSATALVPWPLTAAKMCNDKKDMNNDGDTDDPGDWNPSVAGCAELRGGTSISNEDKQSMAGQGHSSVNAAGGSVAPSIEVPNGHNTSTISHEAMGHSMMGKMHGPQYGLWYWRNKTRRRRWWRRRMVRTWLRGHEAESA